MRTKILIVMMSLILSACNGGGGGSSAPAVIDARLSLNEWQTSYVVGTSNWVDELEFVGDQVVWTRTQYFGGGIGGPYVETYELTPLSATSFQTRNISDNALATWTYSFNGANFELCDEVLDCVEFIPL